MKFWERFSRITYNLITLVSGKKIQVKSIESVLKNAIALIAPESLNQMRSYVINQQTNNGGFTDRAGKCDIYYSLFGYYVAEALDVTTICVPLKQYVLEVVQKDNLKGINLHCTSILYTKLFGLKTFPNHLRKRVLSDLQQTGGQLPVYSNFLSLLSFYYLKDLKGIYRIIKNLKTSDQTMDMPCPVTAAQTVLLSLTGKPFDEAVKRLMSFYRGKGGFAALHQTPAEDLLSTAVALYALHFTESDTRMIKPDCLGYVDSLFCDGGFRSTELDVDIDIEYTFYGLLALGSLNN